MNKAQLESEYGLGITMVEREMVIALNKIAWIIAVQAAPAKGAGEYTILEDENGETFAVHASQIER